MDIMDKYLGQMLDGRYEILEVIGTGGMAIVYKARDHRLNRLVAVKILKEELALDADFRRRFHTESQAVAMLSHPNIVTVYDVSLSSNVDYIVMELIDGITLKQYMQRKGFLTWKESLHFAIQIVKALAHAHSRGIIHRDIKPHNIMILRDGSVKVADFGIARLQSNQNTLTQETLGSVHYISPEQAKGSHVDERTDLYSLGVVMYEMLTTRLPFEGDSPVSVAIQHISAVPLMPRDINPDIPAALESITMKAMNPNLDERYLTAEEMYNDLEEFRKDPSGAAVSAPAAGAVVPSGPVYEYQNQNEKTQKLSGIPGRVKRSVFDELPREEYIRQSRKSRQTATLIGVFCVVLFIIGLFVFLWNFWLKELFTDAERIEVPNVIGKRYEDVLSDPQYDAFVFVPAYETNENYDEGYIFNQSPVGGREVAKLEDGTKINITVSMGKEILSMPNLVNQEYRKASIDLQNMDLVVDVTVEASADVTKDYVIRTIPAAGEDVSPGMTVYLVVSGGPEVIYAKVPQLVGLTRAAAQSRLDSLNLTLGEVTTAESDRPEGEVIWQNIEAGEEVPERTSVSIQISEGPKIEMVRVPNIVGLPDRTAAENLLKTSGLEVGEVTSAESQAPAGQVIWQGTVAGTEVEKGSVVNFEVSLGPTVSPDVSEPGTDDPSVVPPVTPPVTEVPPIA